jgi:hypothetical protein
MVSKSDWLKKGHIPFHEQIESTWDYIKPGTTGTKLTDFGYDPNSAIYTWITVDFYNEYQAYDLVYEAWKDKAERTPTKQAALVSVERNMKASYRELYGLFRGNRLVHDDDLVHMSMPRRHTGGNTPSPDPSTFVDCEVELTGPAVILLHWFNKGASRGKAKPYGMRGVEMCSAILGTPPVDWSELRNSTFDTRSPLKVTFTGEDRGKIFYFAFRWENNVGVKGDWSEIFSVRIP